MVHCKHAVSRRNRNQGFEIARTFPAKKASYAAILQREKPYFSREWAFAGPFIAKAAVVATLALNALWNPLDDPTHIRAAH